MSSATTTTVTHTEITEVTLTLTPIEASRLAYILLNKVNWMDDGHEHNEIGRVAQDIYYDIKNAGVEPTRAYFDGTYS